MDINRNYDWKINKIQDFETLGWKDPWRYQDFKVDKHVTDIKIMKLKVLKDLKNYEDAINLMMADPQWRMTADEIKFSTPFYGVILPNAYLMFNI